MNTESAIALIEDLIYKPGWTFEANDHSKRFEGCVSVKITYPARNSDRDKAPDGYPEDVAGGARASFPILVAGLDDDCDLYRAILERITEIEIHEAREFLRVKSTYWAPFHPHRIGGMRRWGNPQADLMFGIA